MTKFRPSDVFFNRENVDCGTIFQNIRLNQEKTLEYHNKNRSHKVFKAGDVVFMKCDRRRKDKKSYKKYTVKEEETILTTSGKIIHKDNLRNESL